LIESWSCSCWICCSMLPFSGRHALLTRSPVWCSAARRCLPACLLLRRATVSCCVRSAHTHAAAQAPPRFRAACRAHCLPGWAAAATRSPTV
jgi:hypothetical protein